MRIPSADAKAKDLPRGRQVLACRGSYGVKPTISVPDSEPGPSL